MFDWLPRNGSVICCSKRSSSARTRHFCHDEKQLSTQGNAHKQIQTSGVYHRSLLLTCLFHFSALGLFSMSQVLLLKRIGILSFM